MVSRISAWAKRYRPAARGSRTRISRPKAGLRTSSSASAPSPHARCRAPRPNSRPTTDASVRASLHGAGKGARRRRIASRTPSGTGSLGGIDVSRGSRVPSLTSRCTISSTKKGLPSVSWWTARTRAADALRAVWRAGPARDAGWALRASGPEIGPDHLNPGPVGRSAFALPAPPPEHEVTPRRRLARQLLHQAGLADARLPDDEEEASAARDGVFQTRAQLHELVVSADEDRLRALVGRRHRRDHSALAHSRQGRDAPPASRSRLEAGGTAARGESKPCRSASRAGYASRTATARVRRDGACPVGGQEAPPGELDPHPTGASSRAREARRDRQLGPGARDARDHGRRCQPPSHLRRRESQVSCGCRLGEPFRVGRFGPPRSPRRGGQRPTKIWVKNTSPAALRATPMPVKPYAPSMFSRCARLSNHPRTASDAGSRWPLLDATFSALRRQVMT